MFLSNKICSIVVTADSEKEAYIKGCKRIAKYVASRKNYSYVSVKIDRLQSIDGRFVFTLYTNIDLNSELHHYCKMCKEYHHSFFVNEDYNCARCNLKNFLLRAKEKAKVSKNFYEEMIKNKGGTG